MPKNKGYHIFESLLFYLKHVCSGKGGKNVKRGKNGNLEETRRDLLYKEFGQGMIFALIGLF